MRRATRWLPFLSRSQPASEQATDATWLPEQQDRKRRAKPPNSDSGLRRDRNRRLRSAHWRGKNRDRLKPLRGWRVRVAVTSISRDDGDMEDRTSSQSHAQSAVRHPAASWPRSSHGCQSIVPSRVGSAPRSRMAARPAVRRQRRSQRLLPTGGTAGADQALAAARRAAVTAAS